MAHKLFIIAIIWGVIIITYIIFSLMMPAMNEIIVSANTSLAASANMSNFPGTQEAVESAPVWLWFIPGLVGIISTVIVLKS